MFRVEKRKPKYTFTDWMKNSPEKLNFINLDRYPIYRVAVEPRDSDNSLSLNSANCQASCQALMNNTF